MINKNDIKSSAINNRMFKILNNKNPELFKNIMAKILSNEMFKINGRPSLLNNDIFKINGRPSLLNNDIFKINGRPSLLNNDIFKINGRPSLLNNEMLKINGRANLLNNEMSKNNMRPSLLNKLEENKLYKNINIKQNIFILRAKYLARKSTMTQQHAAIIVYHNKIIGEGVNKSIKLNNKYSIHAEVAAINEVKKKNITHLLKSSTLYVIRVSTINNKCCLRNSKPCNNCKKYIEKYNIPKIYYSLDEINIEDHNIVYNKNKFNY